MDVYDEGKCIGRGNYGSAHIVTHTDTKAKYVVKKVSTTLLSEEEQAQTQQVGVRYSFVLLLLCPSQAFCCQEVTLLRDLDHVNIVKYHDSFVEDEMLHIVMGYCERGDLADRIKAEAKAGTFLEEKQCLDWFVQIASAVSYMHGKRILHRDLKTSNIFLTRANIAKLGDFGIAKVLDSTMDRAKTVVGKMFVLASC
jgi:NIMA (never in mitosis gene a)-related kinase